jgi:uncharacterized protein (TIGR02996 family)
MSPGDGEAEFIRAIQATPHDTALLSVYADWLEERSDRRAQFLRLRVRLAQMSPVGKKCVRLEAELRRLRSEVPTDWLAQLDRTRIDRCPLQFAYECPRQWEALQPTENAGVRFCTACQQAVYYCSSLKQARREARAGHCVAVDSTVRRRSGDLLAARTTRMGRIRVGVLIRPRSAIVEGEERPPAYRPRQRNRDRRHDRSRRLP